MIYPTSGMVSQIAFRKLLSQIVMSSGHEGLHEGLHEGASDGVAYITLNWYVLGNACIS